MVLWRLDAEEKVDRIFVVDRRKETCIKYEHSWGKKPGRRHEHGWYGSINRKFR